MIVTAVESCPTKRNRRIWMMAQDLNSGSRVEIWVWLAGRFFMYSAITMSMMDLPRVVVL